MLSVVTNMQAMFTSNILNKNQKMVSSKTEKLSSGYKLNRAADDAAGLTISEKMRSQIRGLNQASNNAQEGISMLQIAEGAMGEIQEMLNRCTELSVKAANGTNTAADRQAIQAEISQILDEIDGIANKTEFNTMPLLTGEDVRMANGVYIKGGLPSWVNHTPAGGMNETYQTKIDWVNHTQGTAGTATVEHVAASLDFSNVNANNLNDLAGNGFHFTCCTCNRHFSVAFNTDGDNSKTASGDHFIHNIDISGVSTAEELIDRILAGTNNGLPTIGASTHYSGLAKDPQNPGKLMIYDIRPSQAGSSAITNDSPGRIGNPGDTVTFPNGANNVKWNKQSGWVIAAMSAKPKPDKGWGLFGPGSAKATLGKEPGVAKELLIGPSAARGNLMRLVLPDMRTQNLEIAGLDVTTEVLAKSSLQRIDEAGAFVSRERSRMGAYQNRLEHAIRNLDNNAENTQSAESKIRDADIAEEVVNYSRFNILSQTSQSMLVQSNKNKEGILSLLS